MTPVDSVYEGPLRGDRRLRRLSRRYSLATTLAAALVLAGAGMAACAQSASPVASVPAVNVDSQAVVDAREALRRRDAGRLAAARAVAVASSHPLALWVEYWELSSRLSTAQQAEVDAFYARWRGSYVEDRLRNDWLLELGRRRDWPAIAADHPRFVMNDDREVTCYSLLAEQVAGRDVRDAARTAWFAQKEADDGCLQMAQALFQAGQLSEADVWRKARLAADANRPKAAKQAVGILGGLAAAMVGDVVDNPVIFLARGAGQGGRAGADLATLALMRAAAADPEVAVLQARRWEEVLPPQLAGWAWAAIGKQTALKLQVEAVDHYERARRLAAKAKLVPDWSDEMLAWSARAALRGTAPRWAQLQQAVAAMSAEEKAEPTWVYWRARALQGLAADNAGPEADAQRAQARELFGSIAGQLHFYGTLAAEELGRGLALPPRPAPPSPAERTAATAHAGLSRALLLIGIGLRNEGVREWNFSLRGMGDRELLAAAQLACERQIWDRCINTSDRTRAEVDLDQRFPTPFRRQVVARTREIGLDAAYVYGLIRQESRFITDARSGVGASGLMQVMPGTAKVVARRLGIDYRPDMLTDRDANLMLGTSYLKFVLDDFGGSEALAAAAYNAGPGRPRRWREGPVLEPAIWAENIPFAETRDYVKKVLSNRLYYAAVLGMPVPSLKAQLGRSVGPRETGAAPSDRDLP